MNGFQPVEIKDLQFNPFTLIDKEWMLVTAGSAQAYNTMTASWGGLGELWKKYVSFVFIRPQRYTMEFVDKEDCYSLCFFDESYRKALSFCGSHSGRDCDKAKETGLTPVFDEAAPYFAEAKMVFICRKMHKQAIDPAGFIDPTVDADCYPGKDYHQMFIGDIVKVLVKV